MRSFLGNYHALFNVRLCARCWGGHDFILIYHTPFRGWPLASLAHAIMVSNLNCRQRVFLYHLATLSREWMLFLLFLKIYCCCNGCHGYDFSPINPLRNFQYTCKQELRLLLFFWCHGRVVPRAPVWLLVSLQSRGLFSFRSPSFLLADSQWGRVWGMENSPYF